MNYRSFKLNPIAIFVIVLLLVGVIGYAIVGGSSKGPVNPKKSVGRETDAGTDNAPFLYNFGELFEIIEQNGDVLNDIQSDIILFARTTRPEFKDPKILVGFTFDKGSKKEGEEIRFTGKYYGLGDTIQIGVTPHGRGVYTLSITNLKDNTNIDEFLNMNGPRNRYIKSLPIQKGKYSIRYQLTEDRVVATFYDGYTEQDINEVVASLKEGLGEDFTSDTVFSINRLGIYSLEVVRQNLVTPIER